MATQPLVDDAPAEAALNESQFVVPSLHCAGCIAKIENGLARIDGIASARVNMSAKRVTVRHDPAMEPPALKAAFVALGFDAEPLADPGVDLAAAEGRALLRALAVAGFAAMNIMLLSVSVWSGADGGTRQMFHWLSALIALPAIAYAGQTFFRSAWAAARQGRTNMDVPISIGVLLTTGMSLYETATGGADAWFDGAVMLLFFLLAGRSLDAMMRGRARASVAALLKHGAPGALVLTDSGQSRWTAAAQLEPGMRMLVAAGERLAADGRVVEGASGMDIAFLTGESAPVRVGPGDVVQAGALNVEAPITVLVTAVGPDTVIADIARLMDEAGQGRSRHVRIADQAARYYAPAVHLTAALAFMGWMIAGAGWHQSLVIAIAVLIITCPCAMGLAVPAAQVVASGALARRGLLVKDGSALERLAEVDTALFDKTGTLTLGEPVPSLDHLTKDQKAIALALAQSSRHPLSRGIMFALGAAGVSPASLTAITETGGQGISGMHGEIPVSLARGALDQTGIASTLHIGEEKIAIVYADPVRADAAQTLAALDASGLESRIVSGDRYSPVRALAGELGIEGEGEMRPDTKLALLDTLKADGRRPLMVGDGINDGPALAAAHASIAPGTASDVSQQAADAVFLGKGLMPVALAVTIARRTMRIVRQNFGFAIGYNVVAVPLALAGLVTPLIAAIAMSLSSLVVVGNSLRLARMRNAP